MIKPDILIDKKPTAKLDQVFINNIMTVRIMTRGNISVLAKAFHSLGKIGDDLFIEPHPDHIAFRTVNMAESAYAYFIFTKLFFSSFLFAEEDNEDGLRCKIAMKVKIDE